MSRCFVLAQHGECVGEAEVNGNALGCLDLGPLAQPVAVVARADHTQRGIFPGELIIVCCHRDILWNARDRYCRAGGNMRRASVA